MRPRDSPRCSFSRRGPSDLLIHPHNLDGFSVDLRDRIYRTWIQLPSATVKGICVEKNTSYGV